MKRIFSVLFLLCCVWLNAQDKLTINDIQTRLFDQLGLFPQEKIHLHTDRTMYISGEKIWFKAYVVDAYYHQTPTYSQYAYIELINSSDSLIYRVKVSKDDNGLFYGYLFLSDLLPEGEYTLRAYTRYVVENQGDDYCFKKNIRIGSLSSSQFSVPGSQRENERNGRNRTKSELVGAGANLAPAQVDFDVSFFPEGGNLVDGVTCRIAFKALTQQGTSESITGVIEDDQGNVITEASTFFAGMGLCSFVPEQGKAYYLHCVNSSGQEKRFILPAAHKTYSLSATYRNKRHFISLKKTPDLPDVPLHVLIHIKGEVLYYEDWNSQDDFITLPNSQLPLGIIQVLLLDDKMNPISERLFFNKNENNDAQLVFSADKPVYQKREKVSANVLLTGIEGDTLSGHASVAVTDNADMAIDSLNTIQSTLLLSSELRGYIESPGYYLQPQAEAEYALDLLMMTHGWRRYRITESLKGNYMSPVTNFELATEISGKVNTLTLKKPVANSQVAYYSSNIDFGKTTTDSAGYFHFYTHFPDSTKFFVQALNQKGSDNVELVVFPVKFPDPKHIPVSVSLIPEVAERNHDLSDFMKKAAQRAQYDENIRMIHLDEVVVTANKIEKKNDARSEFWMNLSSDVTIPRSTIEKKGARTVTELLYGVAGVLITTNGGILIRGVQSLSADLYPLVLIDGMPVSWPEKKRTIYDSPLESVNIDDVESVDVFKGASAAIFGVRGSNGVISITTKRGSDWKNYDVNRLNCNTFSPLGYQSPIEFYAPKYDTPASKNSAIPDVRTTIFWKPDLLIPKDGKASFEFYTADFPTTYSVVIEGITTDGRIIRQVKSIEVK